MEKIAIMTDTNSGMTPEEAAREDVCLLPMPFTVESRTYFEYQDIGQQEFYVRQAQGLNISSSQPAPADLAAVWDGILESHDRLLYIPMSSGLSGSCATAQIFAEDYGGRVIVVDNRRISVTQKQSVLEAVRLRAAGRSAGEIAARLMEKSMEARIYITVDELKYLKQGGRITPAVAAVGTMLNIKPVMEIQGGKLDMFHKVRGMKQAKAVMLEAVRRELETEFAGRRVIIAAAYSGDAETGEAWVRAVQEAFPGYPFMYDPLPLSIGCHTGPGALGAGILTDYDL